MYCPPAALSFLFLAKIHCSFVENHCWNSHQYCNIVLINLVLAPRTLEMMLLLVYSVLYPMDYAVLGILQARILEWVAFPSSRGYSQSKDWTQVSCIGGGFFTSWATREAHLSLRSSPKISCTLMLSCSWCSHYVGWPSSQVTTYQNSAPLSGPGSGVAWPLLSSDHTAPQWLAHRCPSPAGPRPSSRVEQQVLYVSPDPQLWFPLLVLNLFLQEMGSYLKASVTLVDV